jgi:hypothetical protein
MRSDRKGTLAGMGVMRPLKTLVWTGWTISLACAVPAFSMDENAPYPLGKTVEEDETSVNESITVNGIVVIEKAAPEQSKRPVERAKPAEESEDPSDPDKPQSYAVPDTSGLRSPSAGALRGAHRKMEEMAQQDNLASLSSDLAAIRRLARKYERFNENAQTEVAGIYARNLYLQIAIYESQELNAELGENARALSRAIIAVPVEDEMKAAAKAYSLALKSREVSDEVEAKATYDEVYGRYQTALEPLPDALRDQFAEFPEDLLDEQKAE